MWLLLMTAAVCWVLSALKVVEWTILAISVTVILAGSIAIMHSQLYLGATDEPRAKDLETKLAHLQRLLNAMQTKLRGVQSELGARLGISIQVTSMDDQSVQVASIRPQCSFAPIPAA
ncbi:MAG: hypothetical protein WB773_30770 [Isosphaeraceae bacterium]